MEGLWEPEDETPLIGIVTDGGEQASHSPAASASTDLATIQEALEQFDVSTVKGDSRSVLATEPALCVVVGESRLREFARHGPDPPVLPVGAEDGIYSISPDQAGAAIETTLAGRAQRCRHQLLSVAVDDETVGTVLRDLSLITAEPAQITELAVRRARPGDTVHTAQSASTDSPIDREIVQVRADGLVVATPAGSHGYARAADGPLLQPGTGLAIVPIAPFVTHRHNWVTTASALVLSIKRDEAPVALRLDGSERERVDQNSIVQLEPSGSLSTLVTPVSTLR